MLPLKEQINKHYVTVTYCYILLHTVTIVNPSQSICRSNFLISRSILICHTNFKRKRDRQVSLNIIEYMCTVVCSNPALDKLCDLWPYPPEVNVSYTLVWFPGSRASQVDGLGRSLIANNINEVPEKCVHWGIWKHDQQLLIFSVTQWQKQERYSERNLATGCNR